MSAARKAVIDALEAAIAALITYLDDPEIIAVDAVLVVGAHYIDDDGDRQGQVTAFPRHGCQPPYITTGLLGAASDLIRNANHDT